MAEATPAAVLRERVRRHILERPWAALLLMGLAFAGFGAATLNLGLLLMANVDFIGRQGWRAVMDGALWQLAELVASGYAGMAAWVVFKACEHHLVLWLSGG